VRLFVSIPLPARQREHLLAALAGGRTTNPDQWHLTLAFLADRDDELALLDGLAAVAARHRPFALRIAGSGSFPGVSWAGVAGDLRALAELATDVSQACRLVPDRYRAHVTVARRNRSLLAGSYEGPTWTVESFDLVHSVLGRPVEHRVLETFQLG
jgi:2'-5' RNA ligase